MRGVFLPTEFTEGANASSKGGEHWVLGGVCGGVFTAGSTPSARRGCAVNSFMKDAVGRSEGALHGVDTVLKCQAVSTKAIFH